MSKLLTIIILFFSITLHAQRERIYSILLTEILADPEPSIGLPELEYIELFNNSADSVNLFDWSIAIDKTSIRIKNEVIIPPQQYLLVTKTNGCPLFDSLISCTGITGLSLPNTGATVSIHAPSGKLIHGFVYSSDLHANAVKAKGGWSLEMKQLEAPCLLSTNWVSSTNKSGGTPGRNNSLHEPGIENAQLSIIDSYMPNPTQAFLTFDQGLDSIQFSSTFTARFENDTGLPISSWSITGVEQNQLLLNFIKPLDSLKVFRLIVEGLKTCIDSNVFAVIVPVAVNSIPDIGDIIFNEIMFHPAINEDEYLEIYNKSNKTIDLNSVYLMRMKATGIAGDAIRCSNNPRSMFPGEYLILAKNGSMISQIPGDELRSILHPDDFPTLPDDHAQLLLTNLAGDLIDMVEYDKSWHLPLLSSDAGVSLERINDALPSTAANWTSAAAPAFGTPGRINSQHSISGIMKAGISVEPLLFSPNRDGNADNLFIRFQIQTASAIGTIAIADINGRIIRSIANNQLLGTAGQYVWNGYSDTNALMPTGIYIVVVDLFDLTGKKFKFRQAVTLANKY